MNPMKNPVHKIKTADITEMDALHRMRGYRRCPDKSEDKATIFPVGHVVAVGLQIGGLPGVRTSS